MNIRPAVLQLPSDIPHRRLRTILPKVASEGRNWKRKLKIDSCSYRMVTLVASIAREASAPLFGCRFLCCTVPWRSCVHDFILRPL